MFSACNAHGRRYVFNTREQDAKLSREILALYPVLHDIEERGSRLDMAARLRRTESVPLMKQMELVINSPSAMKLSPKSKLGQAAR